MDENIRYRCGFLMLKSLSTLWPYMHRYRRGLALGIGSLLMKDALAAALPVVIKDAVDSLTHGFQLRIVLDLAGLLIGLSLVKGVFQYWMRVILIGISRDIEFDLRNDLFSHLVELSQDFYARYRTGDIMARATNDLNAVRMMLGPGVMYCTETAIMLVLSAAVMIRYGLAADADCADSGAFGSASLWFFSAAAFKTLRTHPENVLRYQQPRSGESGGRARRSRLRAGAGRGTISSRC